MIDAKPNNSLIVPQTQFQSPKKLESNYDIPYYQNILQLGIRGPYFKNEQVLPLTSPILL